MACLYWLANEDITLPRASHLLVQSPMPIEEPYTGPPGGNFKNPILEYEEKPIETVSSEVWTMQYRNMFKWLFWAQIAVPPTALAAMNGDFEAFYWFMLTKKDLLPEGIQKEQLKYFNRMNGVVIGFRNTSYKQPLTNWTDFPIDHKNDFDSTPSDDEDEDPFKVEASKNNFVRHRQFIE